MIVCLLSSQGGIEDNGVIDEFEAVTLTLVVMAVDIIAGDGESTETMDGGLEWMSLMLILVHSFLLWALMTEASTRSWFSVRKEKMANILISSSENKSSVSMVLWLMVSLFVVNVPV